MNDVQQHYFKIKILMFKQKYLFVRVGQIKRLNMKLIKNVNFILNSFNFSVLEEIIGNFKSVFVYFFFFY